MARGASAAARRPAERRARPERSRAGRAGPLPRRVSGPAPSAGGAVVALPGRVLRTPLARVARTRTPAGPAGRCTRARGRRRNA